MPGKPFVLRFGEGMVLERFYLLQVENKLSQLVDTDLGNVCGGFSRLKEALQGIECGIGYPGGIFALALGTGAESVSLDQGVEPGCPTLKFNDVVQLLLKID